MSSSPLLAPDANIATARAGKAWLLTLALLTPALAFYAVYFLSPLTEHGYQPTGFVFLEMYYYMSNAREYADAEHSQLLYASPFTTDRSPAIYFQPHIFALGWAMRIFGNYPGTLFLLFGLISGLAYMRILVAFHDHLFGRTTRGGRIGVWFLAWGGGLFCLTGLLVNLFRGQGLVQAWRHNAFLDLFDGWWFLNLGRNIVFPTEAYYHALFFGALLCLLKRRFGWVLVLTLTLSLSHPFTGTELLLILAAYLVFERVFTPSRPYPTFLYLGLLGTSLLHFLYYGVFLMSYPQHRQLVKQWSLNWSLDSLQLLLAYGLAALLALGWIWRSKPTVCFKDPNQRLWAIWFAVAFLLINHGLFIAPPLQPVHFARGYVWAPLFLLGFPLIKTWFDRPWPRRARLSGVLLGGLAVLLLSDNLLWMSATSVNVAHDAYLYNAPGERAVYAELNKARYCGHVLVSNDFAVSYKATTYTPLRSWYSHGNNTLFPEKRLAEIQAFFQNGAVPAGWRGRRVCLVVTTGKLLDEFGHYPPGPGRRVCPTVVADGVPGRGFPRGLPGNFQRTYESRWYQIYTGVFPPV